MICDHSVLQLREQSILPSVLFASEILEVIESDRCVLMSPPLLIVVNLETEVLSRLDFLLEGRIFYKMETTI